MSEKLNILSFAVCCLIVGAFGAQQTIINQVIYVLDTSTDNDTLTVNATVRTLGYIGFGISPTGSSMAGADIVIAGLDDETGEGYIGDYFGTANTRPTLDAIQNVELISARKNNTHTMISFRRPLNNTADPDDDLPVLNQNQYIMWAIGSNDNVTYHGDELRGFVQLNLFEGQGQNQIVY